MKLSTFIYTIYITKEIVANITGREKEREREKGREGEREREGGKKREKGEREKE